MRKYQGGSNMQCQKLKTYMETGRVVFVPAKAIRPNPAQPRKIFREEALEESELDKEIEDAEIVAREASDDEFYGSWTAPSEKAEYLYGNIDLTIKSNRTWKGNVTNISLKGSWEPYEGGIHIKDNEGLINWKLYFTDDNVMLMEDIDDLGNPIVLKKK